MKIHVNGTPVDTDCTTLAELLDSLDHARDRVATAINGDFVANARRAERTLEEGDAVDIIAPMAGG